MSTAPGMIGLDALQRAEAHVRRAARRLRDARRGCRQFASAVPIEVRRAFASAAARRAIRAADDLHLAARAIESSVAVLAGELLDPPEGDLPAEALCCELDVAPGCSCIRCSPESWPTATASALPLHSGRRWRARETSR